MGQHCRPALVPDGPGARPRRSHGWLWLARGWLILALLWPPAGPVEAGHLPWRLDERLVAGAAVDKFAPAVSSGLVVWSERRESGAVIRGRYLAGGAEFDIAATRVDSLAVRDSKLAPALSGRVVVWQNRGVNADGVMFDRIYGRDLAEPANAPFPIASTRSGQLRPAISGSTIVWADNRRGNWDIFGFDLITRREFVVTTRPGDQLWPAIDGNLVVWADEVDGEWQISGKDLATGEELSISRATGNQTMPSINGRTIVWEDTRAGRTLYDIYGYDVDQRREFVVTTASEYQLRPMISDNLIIWEDFRGGERDLYAYDRLTGREFALVTGPGIQWQPAIDGNLVVWSDGRSGGFDIYAGWLRKGTLGTGSPDRAFAELWRETDDLVANGTVERTWLWGPTPFQTGTEEYVEAPTGRRLVQYFDKSRMEITRPGADRNGRWFVTNGLLVQEMISGRLQTGDQHFEMLAPAEVPIAGDGDDPLGPTYGSLRSTLARPAGPIGSTITEAIDRTGTIRRIRPPQEIALAYLVPETNHAIASIFWDFLNSQGVVQRDGRLGPGRLFEPVFFASGLPITEPYWTRVRVGGQVKDVLVQAFERRILTYTPSNPPAWRVEMGNVGRHYYRWRYGP